MYAGETILHGSDHGYKWINPGFQLENRIIIGQLREMRSEFKLSFEPEMNRCTLCNSIIRKIEPFEMEILKTKEYIP
ncbi:MAG: hypothetical protein OIN84_12430 [Candidatus Methanoperedens sp.]|nr:hypothetical protein [Candidatus Methanoperedens sp. BLZ2]KAB2947525.1 MAG: hypothetical protein F9K14_03715 [Candidatus Methanoperedens sp.]MBZ0173706.1 hypothetical protein [Candidatus Methanoperedens nitroreducens]MCX9078768.1 hypothetical protein [Candidatus Methanoperedens sp.]